MANEGTGDPGNTGGAGESNTPTFQESLGEHSENEIFTGIEDTGGLAAKTIELNTSLEELRGQHVAPDKVEGYVFEEVEGSLPINEDSLVAVKQFALDNGWSNETFKQALQIEQEIGKGIVDAHNAKIDAATEGLKKEMGDEYEPNIELAKKVLNKFGSEGLRDRADDLASDPDILKLIVSFGKVISQDTLEGQGGGAQGGSEKSVADKLYDGK